jgi:hypothetical protein
MELAFCRWRVSIRQSEGEFHERESTSVSLSVHPVAFYISVFRIPHSVFIPFQLVSVFLLAGSGNTLSILTSWWITPDLELTVPGSARTTTWKREIPS